MSLKYRRLDSNGDYLFGQGSQTFLTDTNAVAQAVETSLGLYQGEWWEDTSVGLPLWQKILGSPGSRTSVIDALLQDRISDVTGVTNVYGVTSSFDSATRTYSFAAYVETEYSTTITVSTTA